ncbi:MAG: hypothetical protein JXA54_13285 [Candidatus Heimdallarchaeota archaeon]|nr:hypothetical protein [Candidatus Heimdallarchaeota archaeon]
MILENPVIITTKQNICGRNIRETLLKKWIWKETSETFDGSPILKYKNIRLVYSEKDVIESDHCDQLNADMLLFGSRHKSEANKPSLLTHITGNLGPENSHGGNPYELAYGSCRAIREAYLHLKEYKNELLLPDFDVTVEATHHGPTNMKTPLIFIEVGSTDIEYQNEKALIAVAKTIMDICLKKKQEDIIPSICFGGGHYTTRFNEIMDLTSVGISHILPKYHKNNLTTNIVEQMIDKTVEKVKWAIIDRNSLNANLIKIIEDGCSTRGVEVVKAREIKYDNIT